VLALDLPFQFLVVARELSQVLEVRGVRLERAERLEAALGPCLGGGDRGGALLVVPEPRGAHLGAEPFYLGLELDGVKGSPRAASGPRGPPRAGRTRTLWRRPRPLE